MRLRIASCFCAASILAAASAFAHGSEKHIPATANPAALPTKIAPLPWNIGGPFNLIDHTGVQRTQVDPEGKLQLLFFGYASCPGICSAALPMMADAVDELKRRGIETSPLLITIDPDLDTVERMGPKLSGISSDFVGLTGSRKDLEMAYDAYQVSFEKIMDDPEYGPIYAHGSHIYLLDGQGKVLTLLPPILPATQVADIVARYAKE
ncbi:SCO1/SenC [Roseovarius litorisediminis]|uniref:SCO1/SenC n=1 Tax=Roseovarius litorisediminis TaxID=1312363 RepID=A0A1Y5SK35_9RHOB|nr:SCO family protein [Roseovarius litorisediminis]SLN42493.1 SCO1/SenC [Roseovarius litorisediminis]